MSFILWFSFWVVVLVPTSVVIGVEKLYVTFSNPTRCSYGNVGTLIKSKSVSTSVYPNLNWYICSNGMALPFGW